MSAQLHAVREEEWQKQLAATAEKHALDQQHSLLQRDYASLEQSTSREVEIMTQEVERLKVEAANLRDELATASALAARQGQELKVLEMSQQQAKAVAAQHKALTEQHRGLQMAHSKLQGEYEQSKAVSAMRQAELRDLEVSAVRW